MGSDHTNRRAVFVGDCTEFCAVFLYLYCMGNVGKITDIISKDDVGRYMNDILKHQISSTCYKNKSGLNYKIGHISLKSS